MNCKQCDQPTSGKSKYCAAHKAEARARFNAMCEIERLERASRQDQYQQWIYAMSALAEAAYLATTPQAMVVYETAGLTDIPKKNGNSWYVSEGVCGFAWIVIKPATSSFAKWLIKNKIGYKNYYGGWVIPMSYLIPNMTQSMERAESAARCCAKFLRDQNINAYAESRMD